MSSGYLDQDFPGKAEEQIGRTFATNILPRWRCLGGGDCAGANHRWPDHRGTQPTGWLVTWSLAPLVQEITCWAASIGHCYHRLGHPGGSTTREPT
jgi:hypothetical protein